MSTTVDERVVEMKFENENFEKGVSGTLKSLDNLKKGLDFSSTEKSFKSLQSSADSVSFDQLCANADKLTSRLTTISGKVIGELQDKLISLGQTAANTLVFDNISAGWEKYGEKTSAVQTIVAATGKSVDEVSESLEKLNWFTDETSYNFTDMTSNIAKFTSAGIDLDTSVTAMEGIATWAAVSGQNATSASRAMYNISQAISAGAMKLIDWKSIQNANMNTLEFKETALETAVALGTLKKNADGTFTTLEDHTFTANQFESYLSDAWFTSDVILDTLDKYGEYADAIYEFQMENGFDTANQAIEAFTDDTMELGKKAFIAAQQAITFSQAIDSVKDAASTTWMNIFESIFGDFDTAKVLWTDMANTMWDIFVGPISNLSDAVKEAFTGKTEEGISSLISGVVDRSGIKDLVHEYGTESWFSSTYSELYSDLFAIGKELGVINDETKYLYDGWLTSDILSDYIAGLETGTETLLDKLGLAKEEFDDVTQVQYGSTNESVKKLQILLAEWGYYTGEIDSKFGSLTYAAVKAFQTQNDLVVDGIAGVKTWGKAIELATESTEENSEKMMLAQELLEGSYKMTGQEMVSKIITNSLDNLLSITTAVGEAFSETFGLGADTIYNLVEKIYNFTEAIMLSEDQIDAFKRTLSGVFSIVGIFTDAIGQAWDVLKQGIALVFEPLLGYLGIILPTLGDAAVSLRSFLKEQNYIGNFLTSIGNKLEPVVTGFYDIIDGILATTEFTENLELAWKDLIGWFTHGFNSKYISDFTADFGAAISSLFNLGTVQIGDKTIDMSGFSAGFETFIEILEIVGETIQKLWNSTAFTNFRNWIADFAETTWSGITDAFSSVAEVFEEAASAFDGFQDMSGDEIIAATGEFFTVIFNAIAEGIKEIDFSSLESAVDTAWGNFKDSLTSIFAQKAKDSKNDGFFSKIKETISGAFGNESADALADILDEASEEIRSSDDVKSSGTAISKAWSAVTNWLTEYVDLPSDTLTFGLGYAAIKSSKFLSGLGTLVAGVGDSLVNVSSALKQVAKTVKKVGGAVKITAFGKTILKSAAAIAIVVAAVLGGAWAIKKFDISTEDIETMDQQLILVAGILVSMYGLIQALKKTYATDMKIDTSGFNILATVLALIGVVAAVFLINKIDIEAVKENWENYVLVFGIFSALILACKFVGKSTSGAGKNAVLLAVGVIIIIKAIKMVCEELQENGTAFKKAFGQVALITIVLAIATAIINAFGGLNKTKITEGKVKKITSSFSGVLSLAAAVYVVILAVEKLTTIDQSKLWQALAIVGVITIILGFFSVWSSQSSILSKGESLGQSNFNGVIKLAAAVWLVAIALAKVANLDVSDKRLLEAGIIIVGILGILAFISKAANNSVSDIKNAAKPVWTIIKALVAIVAAVLALTVSAGLVIAAIGKLTEKLSGYGTSWAEVKSVAGFFAIVAAVATAMGAGLVLISTAIGKKLDGKTTVNALKGVAAITAAVGVLILIADIIVSDIGMLLKKVKDDKVDLNELYSFSEYVGCIAAVILIVGTLGVLIAEFVGTAVNWGALLNGLGAIAVIVVGLLAMIDIVIADIWGLFSFLANRAADWGSAENLKKRENVTTFLESLTEWTNQIATMIGEFKATKIASYYDALADYDVDDTKVNSLNETIQNLDPFADTLTAFPDGMTEKATDLAGAISAIASISDDTEKIEGLESTITTLSSSLDILVESMDTDMETTITAYSGLMDSVSTIFDSIPTNREINRFNDILDSLPDVAGKLVEFSSILKGGDDDPSANFSTIKQAITCMQALVEIKESDIFDTNWFGGNVNHTWGVLSEGLGEMGQALVDFASAFGNEDFEYGSVISSAIEPLKTLADFLNTSMPASDGVWQWLSGDVTWSTLSTGLADMGKALVSFSDAFGNTDFAYGSVITSAIEPMTALANLLGTEIPGTSGMWQKLFGEAEWDTLSTGLVDMADALIAFGEKFIGKDNAISKISTIVPYVQQFTTAISQMTYSNGTEGTDFGNYLTAIGNAIDEFDDKVEGTDYDNIELALSHVTSMLTTLQTVETALTGTNGANYFEENCGYVGRGIKSFEAYITGLDTYSISLAAGAVHDIAEALEWVSGKSYDVSGFNSVISTIGDGLGDVLVNGFTVNVSSSYTELAAVVTYIAYVIQNEIYANEDVFTGYGKDIFGYIMNGINSINTDVGTEEGTIVDEFLSMFDGIYDNLYSSGESVGEGFKDGILSSFDSVKAAGKLLMSALNTGAASGESSTTNDGSEIINFCNKLSGIDGKSIETLTSNISSLTDSMKRLTTGSFDTTNFANACTNISSILNSGIFESMSSLETVTSYVATLFSNLIFAISSKLATVYEAGSWVADWFCTGIFSKMPDIYSYGKQMATQASLAASTNGYSKLWDAGYYACLGFARGLTSDTSAVYAAGTTLGTVAYKAACKALEVKSPSKKFFKVGEYADLGFVNGMDHLLDVVSGKAEEMADTAVISASSTLNSADGLNLNPVITPTLDLSQVTSEAKKLNGMFNDSQIAAGVYGSANSGTTNNMSNTFNVNNMNEAMIDYFITRMNRSMGAMI